VARRECLRCSTRRRRSPPSAASADHHRLDDGCSILGWIRWAGHWSRRSRGTARWTHCPRRRRRHITVDINQDRLDCPNLMTRDFCTSDCRVESRVSANGGFTLTPHRSRIGFSSECATQVFRVTWRRHVGKLILRRRCSRVPVSGADIVQNRCLPASAETTVKEGPRANDTIPGRPTARSAQPGSMKAHNAPAPRRR